MVWLYVPGLEAWSSASRSRSAADAVVSVTLSKIPTRRPLSWTGWARKPWIGRLCGTILNPSAAARGAAAWISSLPATPASRSARRASCSAARTPATSGPTSPASSGRPAPSGCSWRTSRTTSASASRRWRKTFSAWATGLRPDSSRRLRSARLTRGAGFSPWPTPNVGGQEISPRIFFLNGRAAYYASNGHKTQFTLHMACAEWMQRSSRRASRSGECFRSSPAFWEWMMGWPTGWTACGSAGTGWSRWLRRSRSALSFLLSRPGALPGPEGVLVLEP